jgi:hypothetical protein
MAGGRILFVDGSKAFNLTRAAYANTLKDKAAGKDLSEALVALSETKESGVTLAGNVVFAKELTKDKALEALLAMASGEA